MQMQLLDIIYTSFKSFINISIKCKNDLLKTYICIYKDLKALSLSGLSKKTIYLKLIIIKQSRNANY